MAEPEKELEEEKHCCHDHDHHDHEHDHYHDHECCHDHDHHDHEHDHHHDHDHECCHDHDHDHDHDHHHHDDDDDECGCGCHDHDHDHGDHDHHHHDHGHKYEVEGYSILETHIHEGATICSFERVVKKDVQDVNRVMENCILQLRDWLNDNGALIGHLKGYVKEAGPVTAFSTVGAELNVTHKEAGADLNVAFASIIFGVDEETMKDKVVEIFSALD